MARKGRIGINIASYLPWAVLNLRRVIRAAEEAGYDFLQILPLKSYLPLLGQQGMKPLQFDTSLPVRYLEDVWNSAESFAEVVAGKMSRDPTSPTLLDYIVFPKREKADQLYDFLNERADPVSGVRPTRIAHEFGDEEALVEVHPGLWMTPTRIVDEVLEEGRGPILVPDLWHLRHPAAPSYIAHRPLGITQDSLLGRWDESLPVLLPHSAAVHVSPSRAEPELEQCVNGRPTELVRMMECVKASGFRGDFVVEATLLWKGFDFDRLSKTLADFRHWVAEHS